MINSSNMYIMILLMIMYTPQISSTIPTKETLIYEYVYTYSNCTGALVTTDYHYTEICSFRTTIAITLTNFSWCTYSTDNNCTNDNILTCSTYTNNSCYPLLYYGHKYTWTSNNKASNACTIQISYVIIITIILYNIF
jgi:hypothetical protein